MTGIWPGMVIKSIYINKYMTYVNVNYCFDKIVSFTS